MKEIWELTLPREKYQHIQKEQERHIRETTGYPALLSVSFEEESHGIWSWRQKAEDMPGK